MSSTIQTATTDAATASATTIGKQLAHESAAGHVTGRARYIDDLAVPAGCLHVAAGTSPIAHGTIESMDLAPVRQSPGVVDLITAVDIPGELDVGAVFPGDPLLANNEISHVGQPIFAVAATSLAAAKRAVALAEIVYAPAAALLDVEDSLNSGAFVLPSRTWSKGVVEKALHTAEQVLEGELTIRGQEHFYLEGQVSLALPGEDGGVFVHASTQHPHEVQELVARVLDVPMHRVQVDCRRMGGGFGGKESQAAPLACIAALFAVRLNRAVKYRLPRGDDMAQTGKRHDFKARYRIGFDTSGYLEGSDIELSAKCGFSPDLSEGIVDRAMFHASNAYFFPHCRITGHRCKTHTVSNTAFRGFGGPQGMVTIEAAMDEIASRLGMDPLDVRKRNLYRPGADETPYGQKISQHVMLDLIEQLEQQSRYRERREAVNAFNASNGTIKKGLSLTPVQFGISFTTTHLNQAGALVSIFTDGSVELSHSGTEMGQGLYTKVAQVVAHAFGLPATAVRNSSTRTDKVPNGSPTAASAGSDMNGMAALDACVKIKHNLQKFSEAHLGWSGNKLKFAAGEVSSGSASLPFAEFIELAYRARTPLSSTGFYRTPDIHFDKELGHGHPFYYYAHGAAASEVAIDTTTGEYRVLRTDILHDVGASLNPAIDLGQIEGGFIQGLGWLTTEELLWDDHGKLMSASPATYKIPTAYDCPPELNVAFYDQPNPVNTVHRSKAVGEPPVMLAISAWCALRNACASVADHRHLPRLSVPATPEQVYWAVQEARRLVTGSSA